jgi:anti-sigma B factor antagonist
VFANAPGFVEIFRMEISQRYIGGVSVIRTEGRLEAGADGNPLTAFRAVVDALIAVGHVNVVVDLSGVGSVDAEGLGELAYAYQRLSRLGGGLTLANPPARVRRLLAVTRLDTVFPVHDAPAKAPAASSLDYPECRKMSQGVPVEAAAPARRGNINVGSDDAQFETSSSTPVSTCSPL